MGIQILYIKVRWELLWLKFFDLTVASTGVNEKILKRLNIPYEVVHVQANSHAGYYPNATPVLIKLIFNKESGKNLRSTGFRGVME